MKKIIAAFVFMVTISIAQAQSEKFTQAMQTNIALLDSAKTPAALDAASAAFERIGDAEKTQWLPYYYAALALTTKGWMDQKLDKDQNAERIKALCTKATAINNNSEIYALLNMAATQQMIVDPQNRWQTYGAEAGAALQKGLQMDPNNPRLYYLQGMSAFNTPEQFGGGKDKAKPLFQKSVDLFKASQAKPLYPNWGEKMAEDMLAKCQ